MNTNGGVFGEAGSAGLGSVLPPNIEDEGFEDLGGPSPAGSPQAMPASMPGMPPMQPGYPMQQRAPMPRRQQFVGLGQDQTPMLTVAAEPPCSKTGPTLVGFFAGALTVGLGFGAYCYFTRRG